MMATTHALAGLVVASVSLWLAPDLAPVAMAAAATGGAAPDLDVLFVHRRTFHYPVVLPVVAVPALAVAAVVPGPETVAVGAFLGAAALHSVMDVFGGGLELRPWRGDSTRAVYDHVRGRWLVPRRWVRYDGAPEDLLVAGVLAVPALTVTSGTARWLVAAALAVSAGYTLVRKPLADVGERLRRTLPSSVRRRLPDALLGGEGQ